MGMMATFFPTPRKPLRFDGVSRVDTNPTLCVRLSIGESFVTLHSVSEESIRTFAADLVAKLDAFRESEARDKLAADDAASRTPDADLDSSELDDQPEEVAKNRLREQVEASAN